MQVGSGVVLQVVSGFGSWAALRGLALRGLASPVRSYVMFQHIGSICRVSSAQQSGTKMSGGCFNLSICNYVKNIAMCRTLNNPGTTYRSLKTRGIQAMSRLNANGVLQSRWQCIQHARLIDCYHLDEPETMREACVLEYPTLLLNTTTVRGSSTPQMQTAGIRTASILPYTKGVVDGLP